MPISVRARCTKAGCRRGLPTTPGIVAANRVRVSRDSGAAASGKTITAIDQKSCVLIQVGADEVFADHKPPPFILRFAIKGTLSRARLFATQDAAQLSS